MKNYLIFGVVSLFLISGFSHPAHADITNGLVGWWKLDGNATDSSGNGSNGTLVGGPTFTNGQIDQAVNLNGTSQYVNVGTPSALNNLPALSISAWIKPDSLSNPGNFIVGKTHGETPMFTGWLFRTENPSGNRNSLYFSADFNRNLNDQGFDPGQDLIAVAEENVIKVGEWNHVVVTWDGSKIAANAKFYVKGSLVGKSPTHDKDINGDGTRSDDSYRPLIIGAYDQPYAPFDGLMDDVRIYNRVLSAAEIQAIYANSFGNIIVNATLDGQPWPSSGTGAINYSLSSPSGNISNSTVPNTYSNVVADETYTLNYVSGGPAGATLNSISLGGVPTCSSPSTSCAQFLPDDATIGLTLNFKTIPPQCSDNADNDSDGKCDFLGCGALPADPGCSSISDNDELPQQICGNGARDAGEDCDIGSSSIYIRSAAATGVSATLNVGSPGTNRLVVVVAGDESSGTNLSAVRVDGKSCVLVTRANNVSGAGNHQEMWYCDEDNLGSASGSVSVTITGGDSSWATHALLFTGASQSGPFDFGIDQTSAGVSFVTVPGIDAPAGSIVVMGAGAGNGSAWNSYTSPLSEHTDGPHPSSAILGTASSIETSFQTNKTYVATSNISDFLRGTGIVAVWQADSGVDLGGATCQSLGFTGGTLGCTSPPNGCLYDITQCVAVPNPDCSDGDDNDGDGQTDYPNDIGCVSANDNNETNQCVDGLDNDGDGKIDNADPGCHTDGNPANGASYSAEGNRESNQIFIEI